MKNLMKIGVFALFALTFSVTSCNDDDPDYSNVTPPTVAQVHNISGSVAGMDGNAIEGATVTMSGTANGTTTTDANGYFVFENVATGSYELTATATGKLPQETSVDVVEDGDGTNVVWNVMLANEASVTDIAVDSNGGEGGVTTEALQGNDLAEIPIDIAVAGNSLNKEATIQVTPIYSETEATSSYAAAIAGTKAVTNTLMTGVQLSCSDNTVTIEQPIELTFNVDEATVAAVQVQKYTNGAWINMDNYRVEGDRIIVAADEFTSYALFAGIDITSTGNNESISFSQSVWDNLYGNGDMTVGTATYTYRVGMDIELAGTDVITALMGEALAHQFGANAYDARGNYPINVTLPIGTYLSIAGVQQVNTITAAIGSRSVSATQYGDVTITVTTTNRNHNGGSNQPMN